MRKHFRIRPPSLPSDKIANCFLEIFFLPSREMGTNERANQQNGVACHVTMSPICSRFSSRGGGGIQRRGTEEGVAERAAAATDIYAAGRQETSITGLHMVSLSLSLSLWAPSETRPRPPPVAKQVCTTCQEVRLLTLTLRLPFFTAPHPSGENTIASARE